MPRKLLSVLVLSALIMPVPPAWAVVELPKPPAEVDGKEVSLKGAAKAAEECATGWLKFPAFTAWSWIPSSNMRPSGLKSDYRAFVIDASPNPTPNNFTGYNAVWKGGEYRVLTDMQLYACVEDGRYTNARLLYRGHPGYTVFDAERAVEILPKEMCILSLPTCLAIWAGAKLAPKEYSIGDPHPEYGFDGESQRPKNKKKAIRFDLVAHKGGRKIKVEIMNATRIGTLAQWGSKILRAIFSIGPTGMSFPYIWHKVTIETRDTKKEGGEKGPDQYEAEVTLEASCFPEHKIYEDGRGRSAIVIDKDSDSRLTDMLNSGDGNLAVKATHKSGADYTASFTTAFRAASGFDISTAGAARQEESPFDLDESMPGVEVLRLTPPARGSTPKPKADQL